MGRWTAKQLKQFADAAQSLKLYRRAELLAEESEKSLIEQLYSSPWLAWYLLIYGQSSSCSNLISLQQTFLQSLFLAACKKRRGNQNR